MRLEKAKKILATLVVVLITLSGCAKEETITSSSSSIDEDIVETEEIIRSNEITDDLILREIYYESGEKVTTDTKRTYSSKGVLVSEEIEFPMEGFPTGYLNIYFDTPVDYNEPLEGKVWSGEEGGEINISSNIRATFDSSWNVIEYNVNHLDGDYELTTYEYDSKGNRIKLVKIEEFGNTLLGFNCTYTYDEYNVLQEMIERQKNGNNWKEDVYTYKYEYNKRGLPEVRYEYKNDELNSTTYIKRDNEGLIIREEKHRKSFDGKDGISVTEYERILKKDYVAYDSDTPKPLTNQEIRKIASSLGFPENANIHWEQGEPRYEDVYGCWRIYVQIWDDEGGYGSAGVEPGSLDFINEILMYTEGDNSSADTSNQLQAGFYYMTLTPSPEWGLTYVNSCVIKGDTIVIKGAMEWKQDDDYDEEAVFLGNKELSFSLTDYTYCYSPEGEGDYTYTKEEFKRHLMDCQNSGLGLVIEINSKGEILEISIRS